MNTRHKLVCECGNETFLVSCPFYIGVYDDVTLTCAKCGAGDRTRDVEVVVRTPTKDGERNGN